MNKKTKTMGVPNCPVDKVEIVKSIFEHYVEDTSTIKTEPVVYKISGEVPIEKCVELYKAVEEIDNE